MLLVTSTIGFAQNQLIKQKLDSVVGANDQKFEYEYNNKGYMTLKTFYRWNNTQWQTWDKSEYEYDSYGNVTSQVDYLWYTTYWQERWKYEYEYDENRNQTIYVDYVWYATQWQKRQKRECEYDANDNPTLRVTYSWNNTTEWQVDWKEEWEYDTNGNNILQVEYSWNGTQWQEYAKREYEYDTNGNPILYVRYFWNGTQWQERWRNEYEYDDNRNLTLDVCYEWNVEYVKKEYEYDFNRNKTMEVWHFWDGAQWYEYEKWKSGYEYDVNQNITLSVSYTWNGTQWQENWKREAEYDLSYSYTDLMLPNSFYMNNKWIEEKMYSFDGTGLTLSDIFTYFWSEAEIEIPTTFTIEGKVTYNDNPLNNVKISYANNLFVYTNTSGEYRILVDSGTTLTLIPSLAGYSFEPPSITCNNVASNITNQDFTATTVVGIVETQLIVSLRVYPNPTTNVLYVKLTESGTVDYTIYNNIGQIIMQGTCTEEEAIINVASLLNGVYFLKTGNKTVKFIKY